MVRFHAMLLLLEPITRYLYSVKYGSLPPSMTTISKPGLMSGNVPSAGKSNGQNWCVRVVTESIAFFWFKAVRIG